MQTDIATMRAVAGAHIGSIFKNDREQFGSAVPYILGGLDRNEKCVYIADRHSRDEIVEALMKIRDVQGDLDAHRILILSSDNTYLKDGRFDMSRTINLWDSYERDALKEGYSGLRATGEMTWYTSGLPGVDGIREYEARVNECYIGRKVSFLCQYDEPSFDADMLLDTIRVHPKIVVHGELCINPYFTPTDEFLAGKRGTVPKGVYERASRDILKRTRLAALHQVEMKDLRRANRKMDVVGGIALDDIQSQVSVLEFYMDLAIESTNNSLARDYLEKMAQGCASMQRRLRFLRSYQRVGETEPRWWDLGSLLADIGERADGIGLRLDVKLGKAGVMADCLLETALEAIIDNMPDVGGEGGTVVVRASELRSGLMITLEHAGKGLPEHVKDKVFECGYSYGRSDGFGLFLAREILQSVGMAVRETGLPGKQTRFEISVPQGKYSVA